MRSLLTSSHSSRSSPPPDSSSFSSTVQRQRRTSAAESPSVTPTMEKTKHGPLLQDDTDCSSLLNELQTIWNDIGESDVEKDECLEIYRRKVDQANRHRAQLRQAIADSEAEIATICSAMGERPVHFRQCRQNGRSMKEELKVITQQLEDLRERRDERLSQFLELREQILRVSTKISPQHGLEIVVDESDLSMRELEGLHRRLEMLRKEKNDRLRKVLDHLNNLKSLCSVLDIDFEQTTSAVHPSLDGPDESKNVSSDTIERLTQTIQRLREVKLQRMRKLQDLATAMVEMWYLMDTPIEEQQQFQELTCNIAASEHEITEPNSLSLKFINHVEAEVARLEKLKASKMKHLVLKKKIELDELCRRTHLVAETDSFAEAGIKAIENESLDPSLVLEQIEAQISIVKEEAFSRKEILERVVAACEEESWLEEYNRDENRYNAGRGTHLMLKRAEKARVAVSKIPGIVEALTNKIMSWENERGTEFIYDGSSLLSMLEEYNILRQEKEHERKRLRDQRRLQGQLLAEQEVMFGSKPNLSKSHSAKKLTGAGTGTGTGTGGPTKRLSIGGATLQSPRLDSHPSFKSPSSAKKQNSIFGGMGDPEFQSSVPDAPETPRKPFTPISLGHTIPSTTPRIKTMKAEEENKISMVCSPVSALKSPSAASTPKQKTTKLNPPEFPQEAAAAAKIELQDTEISFEERRLALLLKGNENDDYISCC
ncbi:65-kDa microtubule-associated protein 9-like [Phalaenopsis equestris]|uniref:65-kDa microtubule-associated protein 9-like n=1 Tax=Phalaenopsis equestris TaxID=78828 RepID=UPI0009E4DF89|nr:65-kDa microtubule-associated protein 9-like [Phalaenopsis equestris]